MEDAVGVARRRHAAARVAEAVACRVMRGCYLRYVIIITGLPIMQLYYHVRLDSTVGERTICMRSASLDSCVTQSASPGGGKGRKVAVHARREWHHMRRPSAIFLFITSRILAQRQLAARGGGWRYVPD